MTEPIKIASNFDEMSEYSKGVVNALEDIKRQLSDQVSKSALQVVLIRTVWNLLGNDANVAEEILSK